MRHSEEVWHPVRTTTRPCRPRPLLLALIVITYACYLVPNTPRISQYAQALQQPASGSNLLQPFFVKSMDSHNVRENTPLDEVVYTLEAQTDPQFQGVRLTYDIEGTRLFGVDPLSGQVRVAQPIDREQTGDSITFQVVAVPNYLGRPGTATKLTVTVYILDENDNAPRIERVKVGRRVYDAPALAQTTAGVQQSRPPIIRLNVSEDTPVESVLVDLIEAIDLDKASSSPLGALCLDCAPEFALAPRTANLLNDHLEWSIVLVKQLTHVPHNNLRQLHVIVSDGKFNSSLWFELTIDDVQNKPPHFISSTTSVVHENAPIDRTILTLRAVDGDALTLDNGPMLAAKSPTFSFSPSAPSAHYSGRQIVYDFLDAAGQSSSRQGDFKLHPLTGQLQVANRLDREAYLSENGVLALQVRARELTVDAETVVAGDDLYESILNKLTSFIDPASEASAVSDITIILVDVNDNAPRWLNATEINAMNQSPVWHQSLPADRDTGRTYQLRVRENSPPGSPITSRNEMFVYDLDNGQNAQFNITLEDPFNLFDVEPKQVNGFSSVSIKLAPATRRNARPLDYENINERSYIIQLHAIETRTSEQLRSKAQIQVNIVDVNDNAPEFKEVAYVANIREDSLAGKMVKLVQASDRDEISRQLTYSLHGQSAYLFAIGAHSGLVSVAKCDRDGLPAAQTRASRFSGPTAAPGGGASGGQRPCIDYELQRMHHLMVEVSDGELASKAPLTIWIEDANDNAPVFALPIVDVVIEEGAERLEPPIRVEATDVDQTSTLSYAIVEGNFEGLFAINNATGELQLTRPIRIAHDDEAGPSMDLTRHQQQLNKMTLIVEASDGEHATNGTIRIDILDANDNAPRFSRLSYEKEIAESSAPGQSVLTVKAFDLDRGNNARVSYRLERGSHGQFEINELTGEITVASQARPFDANRRDNYTLEVVAYDHGLISKSSSVSVLIRLLGAARRPPHFEPQIQRETINENTLNNTIIHRMSIRESQQAAGAAAGQALFFEPGPIEGFDKHSQPVGELERLESMFSVSTHTGDVMVNSGLSHDFAAYINLTIFVSYRPVAPAALDSAMGLGEDPAVPAAQLTATTTAPRSVGYLVINVVDDNDNAPVFAPPWTPSQPELSFQMLEELPPGSILAQLGASDANSRISHYEIEPANEYFELTSPQSGVIVNKKTIDYDTLMRQTFLSPASHSNKQQQQQSSSPNNIIQFNVLVYDSGLRQLSAKATVSVEILPINDNDCKFEQQLYEVHVRENAHSDTVLVQVRANDLDFGEPHSALAYQLIGDQRHLFAVDQRTGVVTVSARGSIGLDREQLAKPVIALTVLARDELPSAGATGRLCSATIRVHVDDVNDNPPLFAQKLYEVTAYDTDSAHVPLVKLLVHDQDQDQGQDTANSFRILAGNPNDSFSITPAGMIYVTKPLAELLRTNGSALIELRVQVRQQALATAIGQPVPALFTDECLVRVHVTRINRHAPEWRHESLKGVKVAENARPGTLVAHLRCLDRDLAQETRGGPSSSSPGHHHQRFEPADEAQPARSRALSKAANATGQQQLSLASPMRYWIKENGSNVLETSEFRLDGASGQLTTRVELDREQRQFYQLVVSCEDNGRPQSLESITPLYITVLDQDDNKPEFVVSKQQQFEAPLVSGQELIEPTARTDDRRMPTIRFQVEEHQSKGLQVGELRAVDPDLESSQPIVYCLIEGNEFHEFHLDRLTGVLYTNQTLDREKQASYELLVTAANDGSTCDDQIQSRTSSLLAGANGTATGGKPGPRTGAATAASWAKLRIEVLDINDNAPAFKRHTFRTAVHHRALLNTLVTQVAARDPDLELNGTLSYRISEILLYKTNPIYSQQQQQSSGVRQKLGVEELAKPIKLIQSPFRIDQAGNLYTQQLLTQYQLMSVFVVHIEASELAEPWRVASTKLEIYVYETNSQLKIRINLHPRFIEAYRPEIESMLSNATKYTAIINRARSYYGNAAAAFAHSSTGLPKSAGQPAASLDLTRNAPQTGTGSPQEPPSSSSEPNFSNIHAIFIDNFRIVNPLLVMERFDLTSAQLFTPQSLSQQLSASRETSADLLARYNIGSDGQANEVSSLIDKIALASSQTTEYQPGAASLANIDWLEQPASLFVVLANMLTLIGLLVCLVGCCCTSRIKDHIIKVALDKHVKQQTLQAKINERVLAATNQAYANSALQMTTSGSAGPHQDFIMQQNGTGMMSSFDVTKGCINNNYENMNILQRAMLVGEYIDPNYNTLTTNGHHINLGAHYYDASELEHQQHEQQQQQSEQQLEAGGDLDHRPGGSSAKQMDGGSVVSLSLGDELDDGQLDGGDLNHLHAFKKGAKATSGYFNGLVSSHHQGQPNGRQRQQVPAMTAPVHEHQLNM